MMQARYLEVKARFRHMIEGLEFSLVQAEELRAMVSERTRVALHEEPMRAKVKPWELDERVMTEEVYFHVPQPLKVRAIQCVLGMAPIGSTYKRMNGLELFKNEQGKWEAPNARKS